MLLGCAWDAAGMLLGATCGAAADSTPELLLGSRVEYSIIASRVAGNPLPARKPLSKLSSSSFSLMAQFALMRSVVNCRSRSTFCDATCRLSFSKSSFFLERLTKLASVSAHIFLVFSRSLMQ